MVHIFKYIVGSFFSVLLSASIYIILTMQDNLLQIKHFWGNIHQLVRNEHISVDFWPTFPKDW